MNEDFHQKLKSCFARIRVLFSSDTIDSNKVNAAMGDLRFCAKRIEKRGSRKERKILLYCIHKILQFIKEDNREKICSFTDLIYAMPDIFIGKRNFYSFRDEIKAFNERFGESCFENMKNVQPFFTKKAPKNALSYFHPDADKTFKANYPIGYVVLVICGIFAFILPLIVYTIYLYSLGENTETGGWPVLAIVGCIIMGVGLFNIVAAFIGQYLGHILTAICLTVGGAFISLSVFMTNHPELYDEKLSIYYLVSLIMLLIPLLFYPWFRSSLKSHLSRLKRISESKINKYMKGSKNFWWYESLHKEVGLGLLYYVNKIFTILFASTLVLTLFLGFIKDMSLILCPMNVILHVLNAFMILFATTRDNLDRYGKPFVFIAKRPNGGIDSFIFDIFLVIFCLMIAYVNILLFGDVWGISLRFKL